MLNKDDNEIVDKIMGKGQVQVRKDGGNSLPTRGSRLSSHFSHIGWTYEGVLPVNDCNELCARGERSQHVTHFNCLRSLHATMERFSVGGAGWIIGLKSPKRGFLCLLGGNVWIKNPLQS